MMDTKQLAEALIEQAHKNMETAKALGGNRVVASTLETEQVKVKKYPVAEIFVSPQGEGLYAGCLMTFVRLAGCSVGKKLTPEGREAWDRKRPSFGTMYWETEIATGISTTRLPVYTEKCCTWDGREFLCDTDFRTKQVLTAEEIIAQVPEGVERICLTGGEPLNHDLTDLLDVAWAKMLDVHIETSGTVSIYEAFPEFRYDHMIGESVQGWLWLTVSPKLGVREDMLELASELKFLVDADFDPEKVPEAAKTKLTYIQPINDEHSLRRENVERCLELQKQFPHWRLSMQAHKVWGVR